jgi:type III pantothenate kinase
VNLIIDIGNTRTKVGVFSGQRLIKKGVLEKHWSLSDLHAWLGNRKIQNVALSNTSALDLNISKALNRDYEYYLHLNEKTALPITNAYKSPKTLGKDRLSVAVAAAGLFPGKNCLVIDAGTCITYDFIDKNKKYQGGSITPGLEMRLKAMNAFTDKLPLVNRKKLTNTIGKDTVTSLRTGAQHGATLEMEGFIQDYKSRFGHIEVLLTGGDANYFAKTLKTKIFVNPNLVLIGLNKILLYNVQISR